MKILLFCTGGEQSSQRTSCEGKRGLFRGGSNNSDGCKVKKSSSNGTFGTETGRPTNKDQQKARKWLYRRLCPKCGGHQSGQFLSLKIKQEIIFFWKHLCSFCSAYSKRREACSHRLRKIKFRNSRVSSREKEEVVGGFL